jgi:hypothetical protein
MGTSYYGQWIVSLIPNETKLLSSDTNLPNHSLTS